MGRCSRRDSLHICCMWRGSTATWQSDHPRHGQLCMEAHLLRDVQVGALHPEDRENEFKTRIQRTSRIPMDGKGSGRYAPKTGPGGDAILSKSVERRLKVQLRVPNPGSDAAQIAGCKCPVLDNHHGEGIPSGNKGEFHYWINANCPVHGTPDWREDDE